LVIGIYTHNTGMHTTNFDLSIEEMTKIEGAAALDLSVRDGKVTDLKFKITEFKRFYTQGVRGKNIMAVPPFVARICGTCSNAHLLCSVKAIESAFNIEVSEQTKIMRKLMMHGLIIRDHALHLYVFSLPDVVGKNSILAFDESNEREHQLLHDTFDVKSAGNLLSIAFGGRSVHAPFAAIGGFVMVPTPEQIENAKNQLIKARPAIFRLIQEFLTCPFTLEDPSQSVGLVGDSSYDFLYGKLHVTDGRIIEADEFKNHLEHVIIPYSHASGYKFEGDTFIVGAVARLNLGKNLIHPKTQNDAKEAIEKFPTKNVFFNNLAQAIEILHSIDESLELLEKYQTFNKEPIRPVTGTDGIGVGVIEAPRGTLYHKYEIQNSIVTHADIIVPTGQNQIAIEKNLVKVVEQYIDEPKEKISFEIEKLVRAYDPCMSCGAHFLKIKWN
jgi:sulfhydrogenase subunit alpha